MQPFSVLKKTEFSLIRFRLFAIGYPVSTPLFLFLVEVYHRFLAELRFAFRLEVQLSSKCVFSFFFFCVPLFLLNFLLVISSCCGYLMSIVFCPFI
jgi:hypothetical protein